ncbi:MAG: hypothetical protein H7A34_03265 [bacterium]|nr:hypothetical protein [bacterium]
MYSQQPYEIVESYAKEQASGVETLNWEQENNISIYMRKPVITIEPAIDGMPPDPKGIKRSDLRMGFHRSNQRSY